MTGPRSAPAGVRRYQTSRRPGSRSAVTIPVVFKLAQALAERLGGDPAEAVHQVGEPLGAGEQVADHQQAPPVADALQGACDRQKWS